jgi:glycosyltransferase involved in cell wall biosynthesis
MNQIVQKVSLQAPINQEATEASPMVSIIIPAYNYGKFLAQAIESAIGQNYTNIEVLVVDDGSTDDSRNVAIAYEPRVKVITQPNQGLAAARNTGIQASRGEYIISLDADDWMEPDAVSAMLNKFEELSDEFGVVACRQNVFDVHGRLINPETSDLRKEDMEVDWDDLVLSKPEKRFLPFALIKREVFAKCGLFDASYGRFGSEDREFFIRVSRKFRICRMSKRLLNYTIHGSNMSADPGRQLPGMLKCIAAAKSSRVRPWWQFWFWGRVHAFFHYQASGMYRDLPDHTRALAHIVASVCRYPLPLSQTCYGLPYFTRLKRLLVCLRDSALKKN